MGLPSREALLEAIALTISTNLEFSRYFIGLGDPAEEQFEIHRALGSDGSTRQVPMSQTILQKATQERKSILVEDVSVDLADATDRRLVPLAPGGCVRPAQRHDRCAAPRELAAPATR